MTHEEAYKIMDAALDTLGEHFDAVQIHATWMNDGAGTDLAHRGSGNWYARESMSRKFTESDVADEIGRSVAKRLDPPDKDGDEWKANS